MTASARPARLRRSPASRAARRPTPPAAPVRRGAPMGRAAARPRGRRRATGSSRMPGSSSVSARYVTAPPERPVRPAPPGGAARTTSTPKCSRAGGHQVTPPRATTAWSAQGVAGRPPPCPRARAPRWQSGRPHSRDDDSEAGMRPWYPYGVYSRAVNAFSATRPGRGWSRHVAAKVDPALFRWSGGRVTVTGVPTLPMLVLTTTGRRSGLPRSVQLAHLAEPASSWLVVASAMGQDRHPDWLLNLRADPRARILLPGASSRWMPSSSPPRNATGTGPTWCAPSPRCAPTCGAPRGTSRWSGWRRGDQDAPPPPPPAARPRLHPRAAHARRGHPRLRGGDPRRLGGQRRAAHHRARPRRLAGPAAVGGQRLPAGAGLARARRWRARRPVRAAPGLPRRRRLVPRGVRRCAPPPRRPAQLIALRVFQGVGRGAAHAGRAGADPGVVPRPRTARPAIGTWAGLSGVAAAIGPVLGGWIVDNASWRWIFAINVPLCVAVVALTRYAAPESRDTTVTGRFDVLGAALTVVALGAATYALTASAETGGRRGRRGVGAWRWAPGWRSSSSSSARHPRWFRCGCSVLASSPRPTA